MLVSGGGCSCDAPFEPVFARCLSTRAARDWGCRGGVGRGLGGAGCGVGGAGEVVPVSHAREGILDGSVMIYKVMVPTYL